MRPTSTILALAALTFLSACREEPCTTELAQKKATDLAARMQEIAASDPLRLVDLAPKVKKLAAKASAQGDDLDAACKAMDALIAELSQ